MDSQVLAIQMVNSHVLSAIKNFFSVKFFLLYNYGDWFICRAGNQSPFCSDYLCEHLWNNWPHNLHLLESLSFCCCVSVQTSCLSGLFLIVNLLQRHVFFWTKERGGNREGRPIATHFSGCPESFCCLFLRCLQECPQGLQHPLLLPTVRPPYCSICQTVVLPCLNDSLAVLKIKSYLLPLAHNHLVLFWKLRLGRNLKEMQSTISPSCTKNWIDWVINVR